MLNNITNVAKTRKFWVSIIGGVVTFLTLQFNSPDWLSTLTLALTAFGVYQVPNAKK